MARALKGRRERAIIATKIWTSSPSEGREQANHALRLFGRVEIYLVHNLVNWPAQLRLLEQLKGEGKVDAVGATHYDPSGFDDLCDLMSTGRLDVVQVPSTRVAARRSVESSRSPPSWALGFSRTARCAIAYSTGRQVPT